MYEYIGKGEESVNKTELLSLSNRGSLLLLFLATGVHRHDERLVGRVVSIGIASLFTHVLDIVQVLKHLIRSQDLNI